MTSSEVRRAKAARAVRRAVARWHDRSQADGAHSETSAQEPSALDDDELRRQFPPQPQLLVQRGSGVAPPQRTETFSAGLFATLFRLPVWIGALALFAIGCTMDWIRGRASVERRARRLRRVIERSGVTFIKLGQQVSMRVDIIPYAYAVELEKMLDRVPPIAIEDAIVRIEQATGPLSEAFSAFDSEPIGSASISCVYQARLKDGERVAIKVRRPGIGKQIAADLRALGWLLMVLEVFVLPPGFTRNLLSELSAMLFQELDFTQELRHIELFRRRLRKSKIPFVTTPAVYPALSDREVLVEGFASGIQLGELVAAVENDDQQALQVARASGIKPRRVARRLLTVNRWGGFEGLLFHADLHPANVFVQRDSKLVLIDFGAVGAFTEKERRVWRRFMHAQSNADVGGMTQAALALLEPLPPINTDEFGRRLEEMFWADLYAYESRHSEWWERSSANVWLSFFRLAREFRVPMSLNMLRMIRATMLVDTLAVRLDPEINQYKEYAKYERKAGLRARKRMVRRIRRACGKRSYIDLEQTIELGRGLFYRAQREMDSAFLTYAMVVGKGAYLVANAMRTMLVLGILAGSAVAAVSVSALVMGNDPSLWRALVDTVMPNRVFQALVLVVLLVNGRRVLYRLSDREH